MSDKLVDEDEAKLSRSGLYYVPNAESKDDVIDYVKTLPLTTAPEAFGMDDNCEITCAMTESNQILESTLSMAPSKSSGGGKSAADVTESARACSHESSSQVEKPYLVWLAICWL